jgi:hypothetical protein
MNRRKLAVISLLLLVMSEGCSTSDPSTSSHEKRLNDTLVACGIYAEDGRLPELMVYLTEGMKECMINCIDDATCAQIADYYCDDSGPLTSCIDYCENPFFCPGAEPGTVVLCNGYRECLDGRDEEGCHFCDGASIGIPAWAVCDGWEHCDDGSDELGCGAEESFRCPDGSTIPTAWVCDGENDCAGGADELGCAHMLCE